MSTASKAAFDRYLLTPEFFADPYPVLHQLRAEAPVYWSDVLKSWVLTRYSDVTSTLRDPKLYSNAGRMTLLMDQLPPAQREQMEPFKRHFAYGLLHADPPDHTRLRGLVNKAFTTRAVENMRLQVRAIVEDLLDAVAPLGQMDVIRDLAYPLPALVITAVLELPAKDIDQFKHWSDDMMMVFASGRAEPDTAIRGQESLLAMRAYFEQVLADRRRHLGDDLLSRLIAAEDQGSMLTAAELVSTVITLLIAGHETTTNLIGSALLALLRNPDQLEQLRRDPTLMPAAIEEALRYESPLFRLWRVATHDTELGDQRIRKGDLVSQMIGAANHDPHYFPDPDRFDISRQGTRQIAFGYGIHFCVGAPLARLEAPIALTAVLRRFPQLRLTGDVAEWKEDITMRGLKTLPVVFG